MPNLRACILGPLPVAPATFPSGTVSPFSVPTVGLYLWTSNGKEFWGTRAQLLAHYQGTTGTVAVRRALTITWVKQVIETALGAEMCPQGNVTADFDETDGTPRQLDVVS